MGLDVLEPLRLLEHCDPIPQIEILVLVMAFQDVSDVEVFCEAVRGEHPKFMFHECRPRFKGVEVSSVALEYAF